MGKAKITKQDIENLKLSFHKLATITLEMEEGVHEYMLVWEELSGQNNGYAFVTDDDYTFSSQLLSNKYLVLAQMISQLIILDNNIIATVDELYECVEDCAILKKFVDTSEYRTTSAAISTGYKYKNTHKGIVHSTSLTSIASLSPQKSHFFEYLQNERLQCTHELIREKGVLVEKPLSHTLLCLHGIEPKQTTKHLQNKADAPEDNEIRQTKENNDNGGRRSSLLFTVPTNEDSISLSASISSTSISSIPRSFSRILYRESTLISQYLQINERYDRIRSLSKLVLTIRKLMQKINDMKDDENKEKEHPRRGNCAFGELGGIEYRHEQFKSLLPRYEHTVETLREHLDQM